MADTFSHMHAQGWPALAAPNMQGPMIGGNHFAGNSSSLQPGTSMVPPTVPANGMAPGEMPRYEGQLVSHIMQVQPSVCFTPVPTSHSQSLDMECHQFTMHRRHAESSGRKHAWQACQRCSSM